MYARLTIHLEPIVGVAGLRVLLCNREWNEREWPSLRFVGHLAPRRRSGEDRDALCPCGSTLAIVTERYS